MKIIGERKRGYSFEEILARIASWPVRGRLLKTMKRSGWLTDGTLLSKLTREEQERLDAEHLNLLVTDPEYRETKPLQAMVMSAHASIIVREARMGSLQEVEVAILGGSDGISVLTPARAFWTVLERHPDAVFRFSAGDDYRRLPILALEEEGLSRGKLLGSIAAIPVGDNTKSLPPLLNRTDRDGEIFYLKGERS